MDTRVLLADGHADARDAFTIYLQSCGLKVDPVASGADVLSQLSSSKPDILVLEMAVPDLGGWEVCRQIRRSADWSELPIISVAGDVSPQDHAHARTAGADAFVVKPCSPDALFAEIQTLLAMRWTRCIRQNALLVSNLDRQRRLLEHMRFLTSQLEISRSAVQYRRRQIANALGELKSLSRVDGPGR
jgi:two-component system, cell cycle response regulator DivK